MEKTQPGNHIGLGYNPSSFNSMLCILGQLSNHFESQFLNHQNEDKSITIIMVVVVAYVVLKYLCSTVRYCPNHLMIYIS